MSTMVSVDRASATCCAVIVHYRCEEDLEACLEALREHDPGVPIVVVENGSGPGVARRIEERFEGQRGIRVVDAGENRGFAAGCNLGIAEALARHPGLEHVWLLNPDTRVTAGCLEALRATARRHRAGVVGGHVVEPETGRTLFENGRIDWWTLGRCHVPAPAGEREFETAFVTGAMMLVDAAPLREGLRFDEDYFLYVEDMDFCAAVRELGRSLWVTKEAVVGHREGGSQRGEDAVLGGMRAMQLEQMTRGKVLFARKRFGPVRRLLFLGVAFAIKPVLGLLISRGDPRFLGPYFRGLLGGLTVRRRT